MAGISIKYYTGYCKRNKFTVSDNERQKCLRLHRPQRLHNIELGAGDIRELTLDANKIEQMPKYRNASFPKSVSTTFVAHYR